MPKIAKELGALAVQRLNIPGFWAVGGVAGLHLQIGAAGSKSWIYRYKVGGRRRDMGLGPYPDVGVAEARKKASAAKEAARQGIDAIDARRAAVISAKANRVEPLTFDAAAARTIRLRATGWKNVKHGEQWANTLKTYASPIIGKLLVQDITVRHVLDVIEPIWKTKTETARRVRNRIELVLDAATARGDRAGPNPAAWKGNLDSILPPPRKVSKPESHRAIPHSAVSAFYCSLKDVPGMSARALEFVALTVCRTNEVLRARWDEITFDETDPDIPKGRWVIPAERMKAGVEHHVPLSFQAANLLLNLRDTATSDLVFPSPREGQLSGMAMLEVMRKMKAPGVPHGFRSTFRTWAAEKTKASTEVCEQCLAHTIGSDVELVYRRTNFYEKRVPLMQKWADYLDGEQMDDASDL